MLRPSRLPLQAEGRSRSLAQIQEETARYKAGRYRALRNLTRNHPMLIERAKGAGALPEWL